MFQEARIYDHPALASGANGITVLHLQVWFRINFFNMTFPDDKTTMCHLFSLQQI